MANPEHLLNPDYPKHLGDGPDAVAQIPGDNSINRLLADALITVQANQQARAGQTERQLRATSVDTVVFEKSYAEIAKQGGKKPEIDNTIGSPIPDWVLAEKSIVPPFPPKQTTEAKTPAPIGTTQR
jgi:hypothetical protein